MAEDKPAGELAREKTRLENKKLKLDIRDLTKPFWQHPTFWLSAVTAVVAIFGVFYQNQLSNIQSAQAKLDVANAELTTRDATERIEAATLKLQNVRNQEREMALRLAETRRFKDDAEEQLASLKAQTSSWEELLSNAKSKSDGEARVLIDDLQRTIANASYALPSQWVVTSDRVAAGVNVRAEASTQSEQIALLEPGSRLALLRNVPRWREVDIGDGISGFVAKAFTVVVSDTAERDAVVEPQALKAHFLNTGTGACTVLECPGVGAPVLLVDCGSIGQSSSDLGASQARDYIEAILDRGGAVNVVVSHADSDHYNLIPRVVNRTVDDLWVGGDIEAYNQAFQGWLDLQTREGARLHNGFQPGFHNEQKTLDELQCGDASTFFLTANSGMRKNDQSIVLMVAYNEFSIIMPGDATGATEVEALSNFDDQIDTTILVVAAHGSSTEGRNSDQWVGDES